MGLKAPKELVRELKILNKNILKAEKAINDFIVAYNDCIETLKKIKTE